MMKYAQLLCLICFLLEVHFQTGNVLPHTQSLHGYEAKHHFIIILLSRSDIIYKCFCVHSGTHDPSSSLLYCPDNDVYAKFVPYQYPSQQYWPLSSYTTEFAFYSGLYNFFNSPVTSSKQCSIIANKGRIGLKCIYIYIIYISKRKC